MDSVKGVFAALTETLRLLPDGIILMTGLFALTTTSYPYAILFGTLLESLALFSVLQYASRFFHLTNMLTPAQGFTRRCTTGFLSTTLESVSLFSGSATPSFPSAPIYILSVLSAYLYNSMNAVLDELEALGESYASRFYISVAALCGFLLCFALFRLYAGCDTFGGIVATLLLGILTGSMLLLQNLTLFGKEAINLLGIPLLRNRAAVGSPLYVCPTQNK